MGLANLRSLLTIAASSSLVACATVSLEGSARDQFVTEATCPAERVTVEHAPPPADIRSDPERVALWNKNAVYLVHGCGQDRTYTCAVVGNADPRIECTPSS